MKENGTKTQDATSKDYTSQIEKFRSLADRDDVERLEALINQISSGSEDSVMPIVLSPDYDKSYRTVSLIVNEALTHYFNSYSILNAFLVLNNDLH